MSSRNLSRRTVLKALGTALALPILQACGGATTPPTVPAGGGGAPTKAAGGAATTAAGAATKPAAAGGNAQGQLRFATWLGASKGLVDKYNQGQSKINVAYEEIPFGQFADKLLIDLASGTAPDVFHWPSPWWIPTMRKKVFLPIDGLITRDKIDMTAFAYQPNKLAEFDGKLWGLPYALPTTRVVIYNKRLFKEAGVAEPNDDWTWTDMVGAAKKIHRPPDVYALTTPPHQLNIESMILGNGGAILDEDGKKCLLDSPQATEAIQASADWFLKDKVTMEPGQEKALGDQPFASDKLAMTYISIPGWQSWKGYTRDLAIDAGVVQFPVSPQTKKRRTSAESHMLAIAGKTKQADAAWEFMKWAQTSDEGLKYWVDYYPVNYHFKQFVDTIADERQREITSLRFKYMPTMEVVYWGPNTSEGQKAFQAQYDLVQLGKKSADQAMKEATKAINDILADA